MEKKRVPPAPKPASGGFEPHRPEIDYGVLDDLLGYAVRRAQIRVTLAFDAHLGSAEMTTQRFSALVLIARNPGLKQTELASIMGIARSGILAIVEALDRLGLVERRLVSGDARAQALHLTSQGEAALPGIIAAVTNHDREISDRLSQEEVAVLKALLARVAG